MTKLLKILWGLAKWSAILIGLVIASVWWGLVGFCVYGAVVGCYIFVKASQEQFNNWNARIVHSTIDDDDAERYAASQMGRDPKSDWDPLR